MTPRAEPPSDPVRASDGRHDTTLVPPQLPPFLATMFDLKPIVGVPKNEEVKLVHAAMRAMSSFLSSELRDSVVDLSMELSQHLFNIQMACHREKYAIPIFPNDIVYTPPSLPSHIPIKLEPVIGPPSDDELRSAHAALRVSDSLLSVPSLHYLDLNMHLSQHLFDLQLARHVQRSTRPCSSAYRPLSQHHSSTLSGPQDSSTTNQPGVVHNVDADIRVERDDFESRTPCASVTGSDDTQSPDTGPVSEPSTNSGFEERHGSEEDRKLLVEMAETLKNINRVLIGSQHSLARGFNSATAYGNMGFNLGAHSLINEKGETPEMHDLPIYKSSDTQSWFIPDLRLKIALIPQYLRFYGIGTEMLEEGEELKIKSGMEEAAKALVLKHVHTYLIFT